MNLQMSNFREISFGKIAPKTLYRSNHPVYKGKQDKYVISAVNDAKIKTVINLCDTITSLKRKTIFCSWYTNMIKNKNVVSLGISSNFNIFEVKFLKKIKRCIRFMLVHEPPYLIHCEQGIDRTGFISILIEALMDATLEEMAKDYMLSFVEVKEYSNNDRINGCEFVLDLFSKLSGKTETLDNKNISVLSLDYLINRVKLKENELIKLKEILCNKI